MPFSNRLGLGLDLKNSRSQWNGNSLRGTIIAFAGGLTISPIPQLSLIYVLKRVHALRLHMHTQILESIAGESSSISIAAAHPNVVAVYLLK